MTFSDFKEISAGQFVSITGGLIAGIILASIKDDLLLVPGLLILIPGFLEMKGNVNGSLASRLSSALHIGRIKPKIDNSPFIRENLLASLILVLLVGTVLGVASLAATYIYFHVFYIKIVYIAILTSLISDILSIPLTTVTCFWLFKKGYDPDNIMGPYVTTTGDIISLIALFLAAWVIV
ncbi:hypothetical protein COV19_02470 [Candidatus Woesearchaeota archaeon CG10_big_fil_rev_8_21_14_0_10_44_13]|nr:MAG: hypothetical protein COV19_02470 [Candidatus Woesearchaeota archaeon CG10_big_fil_rev_8_21_14_0_10_44_13]